MPSVDLSLSVAVRTTSVNKSLTFTQHPSTHHTCLSLVERVLISRQEVETQGRKWMYVRVALGTALFGKWEMGNGVIG